VSLHFLRLATASVTGVQLALTGLALLGSDEVKAAIGFVFFLVFLIGSAAFLGGFLIAVGRSRTEEVSVAGVFFLSDGALSSKDRRWLFGFLAAQSVIGLLGAFAAPFTPLAFGILVPMFGMGAVALAGARHGEFTDQFHAS